MYMQLPRVIWHCIIICFGWITTELFWFLERQCLKSSDPYRLSEKSFYTFLLLKKVSSHSKYHDYITLTGDKKCTFVHRAWWTDLLRACPDMVSNLHHWSYSMSSVYTELIIPWIVLFFDKQTQSYNSWILIKITWAPP